MCVAGHAGLASLAKGGALTTRNPSSQGRIPRHPPPARQSALFTKFPQTELLRKPRQIRLKIPRRTDETKISFGDHGWARGKKELITPQWPPRALDQGRGENYSPGWIRTGAAWSARTRSSQIPSFAQERAACPLPNPGLCGEPCTHHAFGVSGWSSRLQGRVQLWVTRPAAGASAPSIVTGSGGIAFAR